MARRTRSSWIAQDTGTLKQLAQSGATLLADYDSFSLWRTSDAQKQAVAARRASRRTTISTIIQLRGGTSINTVAGTPAVVASAQQTKSSGKQLWMVQFVGPIKPAWLARLRKAGIEVVAYMPNNAYVDLARWRATDATGAAGEGGPDCPVDGRVPPAYRIAPPLQAAKVAQAAQPVAVTIQLYKTTGTPASIASLRGLGGKVLRGEENILNLVNISLDVPGNQIAAIASRADVFNVEPYTPPKKKDEVQGQIVAGNVTTSGANVVPTGPGYRQWLIDHGFPETRRKYPVVDVVDDGIDNGTTAPLHPDFYQRWCVRRQPSRLIFNNNCTTDAMPVTARRATATSTRASSAAYKQSTRQRPTSTATAMISGSASRPSGSVAGTKNFPNSGAFRRKRLRRTPMRGPFLPRERGRDDHLQQLGQLCLWRLRYDGAGIRRPDTQCANGRQRQLSRCCMSSPPATTDSRRRKKHRLPRHRQERPDCRRDRKRARQWHL